MKRHLFAATALLCLLSLLTGCALFESAPLPTLDPNMIQTYAAQTIQASQTFSALQTLVAVLTAQPSGQQPTGVQPTGVQPETKPTATLLPPTETLVPSLTPVKSPVATLTPVPPPATATPSVPCLYAGFVTDVTIPDGTTETPNAKFTKTWEFANKGTCTWTTAFSLVFSSGDSMRGPATGVAFPNEVKPGQTVNISIDLFAPGTAGSYTGYYQLKDASGNTFGVGAAGTGKFYVKINVAVPTLSDLHLVTQLCAAVWKSQAGTIACPSLSYDFVNGSVTSVAKPKLEGGYTDDESAIVMVPNNGQGGMIVGRFPSLVIKSGDHFITMLGLMNSYTKGNVTFQLFYSAGGGADQSLGTWNKTYTSSFVHVDIDLSSLAGKNVQFVLKVLDSDNASTDDVAFWLNPQISRP